MEKYLNKIINADCLDILRELPDKCVDLVLTDPPYGINFDNKIRDKKQKNWDNKIPSDDIFNEIIRISKNQIIWGANYFPILWKDGCRCFLFWNKDINFDTYSAGEMAYTSFKKPAKYYYYAWNGLSDGIKGRNKKEKTIHPTQKPVQLFEMCLNDFSKENDIILDCFSGSGTTAIACNNLKRNFICIEKDKDYYEAS